MILEPKHRKVGNSVSVTEGPDGSLPMSLSKAEVTRQIEAARDVMRRYRHTLRELAW